MTTEEENKRLRYWLWLRHGHEGLYGDDGEMQCGLCRLDFQRCSVEELEKVFDQQALRLMTQASNKGG
jgi:hypothetical protein